MRIYSGDTGCLTPQRPYSNVSEVTYETGIDIFVDGKPFQIKCFKDPAGRIKTIKKHLKDNPEVEVYVNEEVYKAINGNEKWAKKVHSLEGFDHETVTSMVDRSLRVSRRLQSPRLPTIFTVVASTALNIYKCHKGQISLKDLPCEIVLTGIVRGGLSWLASNAVKVIGGRIKVIGPAGVVVLMPLFSAGAVYGSGYVMNMIDHWLGVDKVWNENIQKAMVSFRTVRVREIAESNKLIEKKLSKATSIAFLPEGEPNCCWMSVWGSSNSGFKLIIPPVKFLQSRQLPCFES